MKSVIGDLVSLADDGLFDVIIHGCNCFCTMGAGIAKAIRIRWPQSYEADIATKKGDKNKLGTISVAEVKNSKNSVLYIVNAYTQYRYGGGVLRADYDAIRSCMKAVKERFGNLRIGHPKIGAGLAGGDWKIISKIIEEELSSTDHTLVEYSDKKRR
jgi:O-acetyl-ADP-ribose deacetylase (regulator of RNase III)